MSATYIRGAVLTGGVNSALIPEDFDKKISKHYAYEAPFLRLLEYAKPVRTVKNYKFYHMEQDAAGCKTALTATATAATNTIEVTAGTGNYFGVNDVIAVNHSGTITQHYVSAISTDQLTIVGNVPGGGYSSADEVVLLSKAVEENGTASSGITLQPEEFYNYTQQFDESFEISFRQQQTRMEYGTDEMSYQKDQTMKRFYRGIARTLYYGVRTATTKNSNVLTMTGGMKEFISTYSLAATSGAVTESNVVDLLRQCTMKGSDTRILFAPGVLIKQMYDWAVADRMIDNRDMSAKLGFKVHELVNDFCRLIVVRDKALDSAFTGYAFVIDPENVGMAQLHPKMILKDIQSVGQYGTKQAIYWDAGLDRRVESSHAIITGLS